MSPLLASPMCPSERSWNPPWTSSSLWGPDLAEDARTAQGAGRPVSREVRLGGSDSGERWISRVLQATELDGKTYPVMTVEDVSERKRSEEGLRFSELSIEQAVDMIYWVDAEGRIVHVNDAVCERTGYAREELLGMDIAQIDPGLAGSWNEAFADIKREGSITREADYRSRDGHTIPVEVNSNYVEYGGNEYDLVFARDITASQAAGEEAPSDRVLGGARPGPDALGGRRRQGHFRHRVHLPSNSATRATRCWL